MQVFEAIPKNWGNSIGVTIPKEIVKGAQIKPKKKIQLMVLDTKENMLDGVFGTLKFNKSTQAIMDEIDKGWN